MMVWSGMDWTGRDSGLGRQVGRQGIALHFWEVVGAVCVRACVFCGRVLRACFARRREVVDGMRW